MYSGRATIQLKALDEAHPNHEGHTAPKLRLVPSWHFDEGRL